MKYGDDQVFVRTDYFYSIADFTWYFATFALVTAIFGSCSARKKYSKFASRTFVFLSVLWAIFYLVLAIVSFMALLSPQKIVDGLCGRFPEQ